MTCAQCGKPVEPGRRKYCSDACAYARQRVRRKVFAAGQRAPARTYDYRHVSVAETPAT